MDGEDERRKMDIKGGGFHYRGDHQKTIKKLLCNQELEYLYKFERNI